ncbi:MAG: iron ABC transporter permease [Rhizomicrobium sp.]
MTIATLPGIEPHDPARRRRTLLVGLVVLVILAALAAAAAGAMPIAPDHVLAALLDRIGLAHTSADPVESAVLFTIRLPRLVLGLAVGATLGLSGAALQALFRNPLADPGLLGVSSGAACGAVGWIVLGSIAPLWLQGRFAMPLCAFASALIATALVYLIARVRAQSDAATLLLAGIAINALSSAMLGFLTYLGSDAQLRSLTFWMMGGLGGVTADEITPALPILIAASVGICLHARAFDLLALGESDATHLGLKVETVRRTTIILVALGVGAAVALTGVIGFVGLAAPHLVRLAGGPHHRFVLPAAALMGALLTVSADIVARLAVMPAELPIGIVTSALGAPFFIWLLQRKRMV